jgi:hypothetical protein
MPGPVTLLSRKTLLEGAGRVYLLRRELADLRREQRRTEESIAALERKLEVAEREYHLLYERLVAGAGSGAASTPRSASGGLAAGKLPDRVLRHMQADPTRIHTAAELAASLSVGDVQTVRTVLARLVAKGLVRRAGGKGQFTI